VKEGREGKKKRRNEEEKKRRRRQTVFGFQFGFRRKRERRRRERRLFGRWDGFRGFVLQRQLLFYREEERQTQRERTRELR
jgi:hypothetical protein